MTANIIEPIPDIVQQIQDALSAASYASRMDYGGDPMCVFTMSFEMQRGEYTIQFQGGGETEEDAVVAAIHHLAKAFRRRYEGLPSSPYPQTIRNPRHDDEQEPR